MKVHTLDLLFQERPATIASYLIAGPEGLVLVESGPASTLSVMKERLAEHGYRLADIDHVLLTHIHLDHAGAAGWLAREGARLHVHHLGAPHVIDPSRLLASAGRIYGDRMERLWGTTVSAPADRVSPVRDGDVIHAGGLSFTALETPGHAGHHHVYLLDGLAFAGDSLGIQLPGTGFIDLPAPPPEFNLELWRDTLNRLRASEFDAVYLTHFGRVDGWRQHLDIFATLLEDASAFVRDQLTAGVDRDTLVELYLDRARQRARAAHLSDEAFDRHNVVNPLYMSVDGMIRYWRKRLPDQK